MTVSGEYVVKQ